MIDCSMVFGWGLALMGSYHSSQRAAIGKRKAAAADSNFASLALNEGPYRTRIDYSLATVLISSDVSPVVITVA